MGLGYFSLCSATANAQKELQCEVGVCYDEESGETVDFYSPPPAVAGVYYIHTNSFHIFTPLLSLFRTASGSVDLLPWRVLVCIGVCARTN